MTIEEFSQELSITMCVWWVFAVDKDYSDREAGNSWEETVEAGPSSGDYLTVTVGDIPDRVVRGIRDYRATRNYFLDRLLRGDHANLSIEERDRLLDEQWQAEGVEDIYGKGRYGLWATFELCRPAVVRAHPWAKYFWVSSDTFDDLDMHGFAEDARDYLSATVSRVQATMDPLHLEKTLVRTGPYLVAEGKAALAEPKLTGKAYARVSSTGWSNVRFDGVSAVLHNLPVGGSQMRKLLRTASRWLWAALAEDEDGLRRFLFSFFGLEILVNKAAGRVMGSVASTLRNDLNGLPIEELMWPAVRDEDQHPYRNLVFRFTCLAVALSRETAADDVSAFKLLAKARNDLAHGAADDLERLPSQESIALLRRYLGLVATEEAAGRLT